MRTTTCVLATALALALGACGGDSGGEDEPESTRASYIAKTDRLCERSNKRTRALNARLQRAASAARDDADLLRRLAPILRSGYGPVRDNAVAFRAAVPPPADEARIARIGKTYDQQADLVRMLAEAAGRGDADRFRSLSEQQRALVVRARGLARSYGFEQCGSARSNPPR